MHESTFAKNEEKLLETSQIENFYIVLYERFEFVTPFYISELKINTIFEVLRLALGLYKKLGIMQQIYS